MTSPRSKTPLRDALYEFSLAKPIPDADLLDEFTRRYPEHATELTDFAIEIAVDAVHGVDEVHAETTPGVSAAVSRAMSAFQNRLFSVREAEKRSITSSPASTPPSNPFAGLDRSAFRHFARAINANSVFAAKLRDRQIDPQSMSHGFRRRVSDELHVPLEVIDAHFAAAPELSEQSYKAEKKPEVGRKQTFEEAVRGCGLTEEQQEYLLKL